MHQRSNFSLGYGQNCNVIVCACLFYDFAMNESFGQYVMKVPKAIHRTRMQTQWNMTSRATSY